MAQREQGVDRGPSNKVGAGVTATKKDPAIAAPRSGSRPSPSPSQSTANARAGPNSLACAASPSSSSTRTAKRHCQPRQAGGAPPPATD